LIKKTLENTTEFDLLTYLAVEDIDPNEYFDANRMLKLKDKLSPEVGKLLDSVVRKLKTLTKNHDPHEFIKQSNLYLLSTAKQNNATKQELEQVVDQMKDYNYIIPYQIL